MSERGPDAVEPDSDLSAPVRGSGSAGIPVIEDVVDRPRVSAFFVGFFRDERRFGMPAMTSIDLSMSPSRTSSTTDDSHAHKAGFLEEWIDMSHL